MKTNKNASPSTEADVLIKTKGPLFRQEALLSATTNGICNRPEANDSILSFCEPTYSNCQSLLADLYTLINPKVLQQLGAMAKEEAGKKIDRLRQQIASLFSDQQMKKNLCESRSFLWPVIGFLFGLFLSACMCTGEFSFISESLQVVVSDKNTARWIAVGISISLLCISHLLPPYLEKTIKSVPLKRVIMGLVLLIVISALGFLSYIRSEYLSRLHGIQSSPWSFLLITGILFLGLYLSFQMILMPLLPHVQDAFKILRRKISIAIIGRKIQAKERQISNIEQELQETLEEYIVSISQAKNREIKVDAMYHEIISNAKSVNLNTRTDKVVPQCFSAPLPQLKFYMDDFSF